MIIDYNILSQLNEITSSVSFRKMLSEPETKKALFPLIGDTLPITDLGLEQSIIRKLNRNRINTIYQLLNVFPDILYTNTFKKISECNSISKGLEIFLRDLIGMVLESQCQNAHEEAGNELYYSSEAGMTSELLPKDTAPLEMQEVQALTVSSDGEQLPNSSKKDDDDNAPFINIDDIHSYYAYFSEHDLQVERLSLSARTYNSLKRGRINSVSQILLLKNRDLRQIKNMGRISIDELYESIIKLLAETKSYVYKTATAINQDAKNDDSVHQIQPPNIEKSELLNTTGSDLLSNILYHDKIIEWFDKQNIFIQNSDLSFRAKNALRLKGVSSFSKLLDMYSYKYSEIRNIGAKTIEEIVSYANKLLEIHKPSYIEYILTGVNLINYSSDDIRSMILDMYKSEPTSFYGFSFKEFKETLPETLSDDEIKAAVSSLLRDRSIEYVDFRCYRVYPKFCDYIELKAKNDIHVAVLKDYCDGRTLQEIADNRALTRQRVDQIIDKAKRTINQEISLNGLFFDDDYYKYLFEHYSFDDVLWLKYIKCSRLTLNYLKIFYRKGPYSSVERALDDKNVTVNQKFRLQKYVDRNKLMIDGILLEAKREIIEDYVLKTYCTDEKSYDVFIEMYNALLAKANVDENSSLYFNDDTKKTRQNRISALKHVLWKRGSKLRYYDTDSRDFTELLETLDLSQYKNTEISTYKWFTDYPELMEKYDIRDHYELHNLLKSIVNTAEYDNNIDFKKQPTIRFGSFDRETAILDIITEMSPVQTDLLVERLHNDFGYSRETILASYLPGLSKYYHNGVYSVDFKMIPEEFVKEFSAALTEDYYPVETIRAIYISMYENADPEDINPFSLQQIGFSVYSGYAVQHFKTGDEYFRHMLLKDDITDIKALKSKFFDSYSSFYAVARKLFLDYELLFFAQDKTINFRRLNKMNISKEDLVDYCNKAIEYVGQNEFFTIKSLRSKGFAHRLDDLGMDDYFYNSLLFFDDCLTGIQVFGKIVLYKYENKETSKVTRSDFIVSVLQSKTKISVDEVIKLLLREYGINVSDRYIITNSASEHGMYYDKIMDKIYKDKSYYYEELETLETEDY